MADKRWVSATGDWAADASWLPSGRPQAGDKALFTGQSQVSATTNLDRITAGDTLLNAIIIYPAYNGNIGASGNPLIFGTSIETNPLARIIHRGSGTFWYKDNGIYTAFGTVIVLDGSGAINLDTGVNGIVSGVFVKRGTLTVLNTGSIQGLNALLKLDGPGASVIINAGTGPLIATIDVDAGQMVCNRNISFLPINIQGGTLLHTGDLHVDTKIAIGSAGRMHWEPTATPSSPTELRCSGLFDMSRSQFPATFGRIIIGQLGEVLGAASVQGEWSPSVLDVDLRKEYP